MYYTIYIYVHLQFTTQCLQYTATPKEMPKHEKPGCEKSMIFTSYFQVSHAWGCDFGVAITTNPLENGCLKDTETWDMWRTHDRKQKKD